jgi:transposase
LSLRGAGAGRLSVVTGTVPAEEFAALADLAGVVTDLLESRTAEFADLQSENAELRAQVSDLAERLAKLERKLSRNSGNSGMAPSCDDLPGRTAPEPKPKRVKGRKPGKQKGAPGAHLAWSENPDETKDLFPEGLCGCGNDLKDAADLGVATSHQLIDTPEVTARLTQYDEHMVQCRCGQRHVAVPPPGAGEAGTVAYGPNVQAWVIFLLVMHHVPVERCADIIGALTGSRPSEGFVHSLLGRAAKAVRGANMLIRALVITASVVCGDETPIRVGPGPKTRKKYLLVACTDLFTCFFLGERSLPSFKRFLFADIGDGKTVLVHDRYQNYDSMPGVLHQLCTQHLLRDLEDCAQAYPDAAWPGQAAEALRGLIHSSNVSRDKGLSAVPDEDMAADLKLFRNAVRVGLSEVRRVPGANTKQKTGRCLLEDLKEREDDVLRFLTDLRIPPTSNQAERDLRPSKTQQKISGRLRSETATRNRYAIRGYLDTARKHGLAVMDVIRDAITGDPWMPTLPA